MVEHNFRKDYVFFNKTIFTEHNVPLPCSDDERIHFYNENTKFHTSIGSGELNNTLKYSSPTGKLFLTSYRIVYRPAEINEYFSSFHCGLNSIISVFDDHFQFNIDDVFLSSVYISFIDTQKQVFYGLLKELLSRDTVDSDYDENTADLPYYCDIEDNNY
ncbi:hypothetical protein THOM_1447 [Trachipleistophora hominis]|uniref:GRAM domain-containing protein n=1 Tax=Trachipleistophora hominis TaxID=72359 RepID=L7JVX8_TRAHO|nr:hypothetical protein THOM_1447 [Trachipleistophora hominis]